MMSKEPKFCLKISGRDIRVINKSLQRLYSLIKMDVDPVVSIKWKAPSPSFELCLLCQCKKKESVRGGSKEGKERLRIVSEIRRKLHETATAEIINRVECFSSDVWKNLKVSWHKSCYSSFTSQNKIKRLKGKMNSPEPDTSVEGVVNPTKTRSKLQSMDWLLCMFCQTGSTDNLRTVEYRPASENIQILLKNHPVMRTRLADVNDLMAAKGKYH